MKVDVIDIKKDKKDIIRYVSKKLPRISSIHEFSPRIENIYLQYVEYKILKYQITIRKKSDNNFRYKFKKENINILVNSYTGKSESINTKLYVDKDYVSKSSIKSNNIDEEKLAILVKNELYKFFDSRKSNHHMKKDYIQSIKLVELKTVYKPMWITKFKDREIIIDN